MCILLGVIKCHANAARIWSNRNAATQIEKLDGAT
jgi:hypothetical protein